LNAAEFTTISAWAVDYFVVAASAAVVAAATAAAARIAPAMMAAAITEAAAPGVARTSAVPIAEDVKTGTASSAAACLLTAKIALQEFSKACAGERRSSARASLLAKRRDSLGSDSPEKLRRGNSMEEMNFSLRIELEADELQQEGDVAAARKINATSGIPEPPPSRLPVHPGWLRCSKCGTHHRANVIQCFFFVVKNRESWSRCSLKELIILFAYKLSLFTFCIMCLAPLNYDL